MHVCNRLSHFQNCQKNITKFGTILHYNHLIWILCYSNKCFNSSNIHAFLPFSSEVTSFRNTYDVPPQARPSPWIQRRLRKPSFLPWHVPCRSTYVSPVSSPGIPCREYLTTWLNACTMTSAPGHSWRNTYSPALCCKTTAKSARYRPGP